MVSLNMITNLLNKSLFKMSLEDKRKVLRHVITTENCDDVYNSLSEKEKKQSISLVTSNDQCDTIFLTFLAKQYGFNKISEKAIQNIKQNRSTSKLKDSIEYYISIEEDEDEANDENEKETMDKDGDDETLSELSFDNGDNGDDTHDNKQDHAYEEQIDDENKQEDSEKETDDDIQVDVQPENPQIVSKNNHEEDAYNSDEDDEVEDDDSLSLIESSDEYSLNEDI